MRNLFFVLVLANLAFAAWHAWFSEPPRLAHARDTDLPRITLVSELPEDLLTLPSTSGDSPVPAEPASAAGVDALAAGAPGESSADAASTSADAPSTSADASSDPAASEPVAARCSSVGPFRELAQAATAAANLRAAGYQPMQRVGEGDIWIGYWVYIDAIATEREANEILARVRDEGVTDSYVIPNSDSGNLVSLGVFSEISGVSRRREEVRALGYEPKIVDRTRRATVYWVDVVLAADQTLDFDSLQTPGRISRLEQRPCEAPAA
jgi:cell division septation protein DedD